ncbi:glycosyltransferase family 2 protein [Methylorubrum sp. SL192]|uniref:glycosyltransferase family 2 protein n=1 Tax=Methylorubrum sp. SL192 TaxID=2995167 RepID=UPI0022740BBC|nr:glycosyltransferase family 2 protein [Methylorubrum sp. SL192]MCY1643389.1 glycosyltransferase family 2 protein [Methylorubrum sp. SL192]
MVKKLFGRKKETDLGVKTAGIVSTSVKNATVDNGIFFFEEDGQIEFALESHLITDSLVSQIILELEFSDIEVSPKIYLDYGTGYSEENTVHLGKLGGRDQGYWSGYILFPSILTSARLDITEAKAQIKIGSLIAQKAPVGQFIERLLALGNAAAANLVARKAAAAVGYLEGYRSTTATQGEIQSYALLAAAAMHGVHANTSDTSAADEKYLSYISLTEELKSADLLHMEAQYRNWTHRPLLSIIMPVFDPPVHLLQEAISCLQAQVYPNWELCIADDASRDLNVRQLLSKLADEDARIKVIFRDINGHISEASNSAASLASGDYLVLMDNDDLLPAHALWTVAYFINKNPNCAMLYSDEDKISIEGFRCEPYNKGKFDRFLMYGHNMFSHLGVYRRDVFVQVGGFRKGYEGSQDYDLTLRCLEMAGEDSVVHIPHVLYHWRQIVGSTSMGAGEKSYAFEAAKKALNDHYARCNYPLEAIDSSVPGVASVRTLSIDRPPQISVVIPTRDGLDVLRPCIDSLLNYADPLMEIVIVDNNSEHPETFEYFSRIKRDSRRIKIIRSEEPFNFSRLCNIGVENSSGGIICLLNNDTEVIAPGMFERARAWLSIPDIGIVGARLLYPDRTIQHFGVYTGVGVHGIAEHCYHNLQDSHHSNFSKSKLLQQFNAVTGACLFIRKEDYISCGGCDESLPVAYNDVDLCLSIREKGLKVICDPDIRLLHKESKSRGRDTTADKKARLQRDADLMLRKWGQSKLADPFYNPKFKKNHATFTIDPYPAELPPWKANHTKQSDS